MKNILFISLIVSTTCTALAQETGHFLSLNAGGGFHSLSYPLDNGSQKGGFGYTLNAGYSYYFAPQWGLTTGLGIKSVRSSATLNFMTGTPATDTDGDSYEFRTYFESWKERQKATFFDIPLGVQYKHPVKKFSVLATAGVLVSLPVNASYEVVSGNITTTGYYSQWNVELKDLPQHGFTTLSSRPSSDVSLKTAYSLFVDLGISRPLSETFSLYAGGYFSYGLNNVIKAQNLPVYQDNGTYNGVLSSEQTNKVHPVAVGLKAGIIWHWGRKKAQPIETDEPYPAEAVVSPAEETHAIAIAQPAEKQKPATQTVTDTLVKPVVNRSAHNDSVYREAKKIATATDIKFDLDSNQPLNSETDKIKTLSELLKANPDMTLYIIGHTCDIGSREVNIKVGMNRAEAVKQLFLAQGVADAQLVTESKAFDQPLVPNTSDENRAKNRRVELRLK